MRDKTATRSGGKVGAGGSHPTPLMLVLFPAMREGKTMSPSRYPANNRFLPATFSYDGKGQDNGKLLKLGAEIYEEPFHVLKPATKALGVNKRSRRVSTQFSFGEFYVIWAIGTSLYKIGVSNNFERRFKDLAANSPLPLRVVKYARCDNPHLIEERLHALLRDRLFKNEWFSLDGEHLATIEAFLSPYFEETEALAS